MPGFCIAHVVVLCSHQPFFLLYYYNCTDSKLVKAQIYRFVSSLCWVADTWNQLRAVTPAAYDIALAEIRCLLQMSFASQERAELRELLRPRLNDKKDGFQDTDLNAMPKNDLSTESRLAVTSWAQLFEVALLPRVLVRVLLEVYNKNALDEPGL